MIRVVEVGPRDGLQNEPRTVPTGDKVAFVDALSKAGLPEIEVSAFVSPAWIPQLADADEVFRRIRREPGVVYSALVPNVRGFDRALAARADKVAVFTAASETFNRKNINATVRESIERFIPVVERAREAGVRVRGYVSTAFWCPFEGRVAPERSVDVIRRLADLGIEEISVGDTIGKATPEEVGAVLDLLLPVLPASRIALHFHDTFGHAIENILESWRRGVTTFDASTGGIGGCPYAPGASGNVATEAVVRALHARGGETGVELDALEAARRAIEPSLGRGA